MSTNIDKFAAANKATVDSLVAVANTALASAERITELNLNTVRSVLEDSASSTKAVLDAKDPKEAISIHASLAQPVIGKTVEYTRSIFEIATQTQGELSKQMEAQFANFQKSVADLLEKAAKSAPAGSEGAVAAIQSAIAAAHSAFVHMNTVAKQFADTAQTNLVAVTKATTAAAKKAK